MKKDLILAAVIILLFADFAVFGQSQVLSGQGLDSTRRVITTAVPFVGIAPDSRATGMGDVGVATDPDANSVHWNNGKLAFIDDELGFAMSYSPWLGRIVDDMGIYYLSGFYKLDRVQTLGVSMKYFDLGSILLTSEFNEILGEEFPREFAFDATYSRKLSEKLGIGVTARYIRSNLIGSFSGAVKPGTSVAVDLGTYYTTPVQLGATNATLSLGANISNIGQKVSYLSDDQAAFIPINMRLGSNLKLELDPFNTLSIALDLNKLLVPTPPIYQVDDQGNPEIDNNGNRIISRGKDPDRNLLAGMFGSFTDAPDGGSEELKEIMVAMGAEYWYKDVFAARAGYFFENQEKGGRQYLTMGVGFRYQKFGVDFSYLIPGDQNNPLAETLRFTLMWTMDKKEDDSAGN